MAATESPEGLMACGTRDLGATAEHTVGSGAAGATASQGEGPGHSPGSETGRHLCRGQRLMSPPQRTGVWTAGQST